MFLKEKGIFKGRKNVDYRCSRSSCMTTLFLWFHWSNTVLGVHCFDLVCIFSFRNIYSIDAAISSSEKKSDRVGKFFWYYLTTTSTSTSTSISFSTTFTGQNIWFDLSFFFIQSFSPNFFSYISYIKGAHSWDIRLWGFCTNQTCNSVADNGKKF